MLFILIYLNYVGYYFNINSLTINYNILNQYDILSLSIDNFTWFLIDCAGLPVSTSAIIEAGAASAKKNRVS